MNKDIHYFGIGISEDVFDVMDSDSKFHLFTNNYEGFKQFSKLLDTNYHCVMEAVGHYYNKFIENCCKIT